MSKEMSKDVLTKLRKVVDQEDVDLFSKEHWFLDSGNYALNYILSGSLTGGYRSGMVVELFGDNSTGKTLLLMVAVSNIQKCGGIAVVNDVEHRWDWEFARLHGVDPDQVIVTYPETVEEFSVHTDKLLDEILKMDPIPKTLFVLDSIAALSTEWELENVGVKEDQGRKAKRIKAAMRVLPKKLARAGSILLCSNHIIENPNVQYGPKTYAPGGKGLAFQSSIRIESQKPALIKEEGKERPHGVTLHFKCVKNSIAPPFGEASVNVYWATGVDRLSGLLAIACDLGIVEASGGWYAYKGNKYRANQIDKMVTAGLLEDPAWKEPYFLRR